MKLSGVPEKAYNSRPSALPLCVHLRRPYIGASIDTPILALSLALTSDSAKCRVQSFRVLEKMFPAYLLNSNHTDQAQWSDEAGGV